MSSSSLSKASLNDMVSGFVKIWKVDNITGKAELVVDKKNLILIQGAQILGACISGATGYNIQNMYIGYNNTSSFTPPVIDVNYSVPFSSFTSPFGYLRVPLAFSPSFLSDSGYVNNTVLYTVQIASGTAEGGAAFTSGTSNIYEIALVASPNPSIVGDDLVFSRVNFNQITYNSSYSLTISWGIKFLVSS